MAISTPLETLLHLSQKTNCKILIGNFLDAKNSDCKFTIVRISAGDNFHSQHASGPPLKPPPFLFLTRTSLFRFPLSGSVGPLAHGMRRCKLVGQRDKGTSKIHQRVCGTEPQGKGRNVLSFILVRGSRTMAMTNISPPRPIPRSDCRREVGHESQVKDACCNQ